MRYFIGIDGGGTRSTLAIADESGREILRREGPAGIVDPRRPSAAAEMLVALCRAGLTEAGIVGPVAALCAGLAGVGNRAERELVRDLLARSGVAERVFVLSDGETALFGALGRRPGVLLVAGTGSIAYGQGEDGRVARTGGWGMVVGDEGSGYALGRRGLRAVLRAFDGRGPRTVLQRTLPQLLGLSNPDEIPPWAGRAAKAEIAALAVHVARAAEEGDAVARGLVGEVADELAEHAEALVQRLAPWSAAPTVVLHGGLGRDPFVCERIRQALAGRLGDFDLQPPAADAVSGALGYARVTLEPATAP